MTEHRWTQGIAPRVLITTYAIGAVGGLIGYWLGLPLGMLLGSLILVAVLAAARVPVFGQPPQVPQKWRTAVLPVIGVAIGAAFPADFLSQAALWWVTLLGLLIYVPVVHVLGYLFYRRAGGLDAPTSFFASMPGGLIESLELGERHGAEMMMLAMIQFLRLILCIVSIPIAFSLATGQAVGSASGVEMPGSGFALGPVDVLLLLLAGAGGWWVAARLSLPAPVLMGPMLASAAIHIAGLTATAPPEWMVAMVQWVVGTSLGCRFAGFKHSMLWRALGLSTVSIAASLGLAGVMGLLLADFAGEKPQTIILAYAPGGVVEMSLVALSLQLGAVFVTLHHLVRITLTVAFVRIALNWLNIGSDWPDPPSGPPGGNRGGR